MQPGQCALQNSDGDFVFGLLMVDVGGTDQDNGLDERLLIAGEHSPERFQGFVTLPVPLGVEVRPRLGDELFLLQVWWRHVQVSPVLDRPERFHHGEEEEEVSLRRGEHVNLKGATGGPFGVPGRYANGLSRRLHCFKEHLTARFGWEEPNQETHVSMRTQSPFQTYAGADILTTL